MHRFKMILEEWGEVNQKLMRSDMSKLIINKHEYICNYVSWNNVNGPDWKFLWLSHNVECMANGETENLKKKEVIFNNFAFFHMFLCTSLYGAISLHFMLKFQAPINEMVDVKRILDLKLNYQPSCPLSWDLFSSPCAGLSAS